MKANTVSEGEYSPALKVKDGEGTQCPPPLHYSEAYLSCLQLGEMVDNLTRSLAAPIASEMENLSGRPLPFSKHMMSHFPIEHVYCTMGLFRIPGCDGAKCAVLLP